jgi:4-amino-4-deoxy-L-arabinose transferase-like glycosyltransferase
MSERQRKFLAGTLAVSVLARVIASLILGNQVEVLPGTNDQVSYYNLALRLVGGHGFSFGNFWWPATAAGEPTAHWSYLYTGFLAFFFAVFGDNPVIPRLVQAVLVGLLQPYLSYLIGRRLFGEIAGLAAAALNAVYTYFVYYTASLMTEGFYITAILASLYLALLLVERKTTGDGMEAARQGGNWGLAIAFGLSISAAVLLRQLYLLFLPFLFLWVVWAGGRRQIPRLAVAAVLLLACIVPFTLYNFSRFDRFVLLNTNAGFAFFWGNHPIYGTKFIPILPTSVATYHSLIPEELRTLDEAALDQALLSRAVGFVIDDPVRYLQLSISRIPSYFMFWPSSDSRPVSNIARVTGFGLYLPFMVYGLGLAIFRRGWVRGFKPVLLFYLFMIVYTGVHVLTWTLIRYRLPVDGVLILFAGLALVDLANRVPLLRRWLESVFGGPVGPVKAFQSRGSGYDPNATAPEG